MASSENKNILPEDKSGNTETTTSVVTEKDAATGKSRTVAEQYYNSPVPPPDMARAYEDMVAGAADRFLTIAENNQSDAAEARLVALHNERKNTSSALVSSVLTLLVPLIPSILAIVFGLPSVAVISSLAVGAIIIFGIMRMAIKAYSAENETE